MALLRADGPHVSIARMRELPRDAEHSRMREPLAYADCPRVRMVS